MASISIVARAARKRKDGTAPVRLRISHEGARRFIRLEVDVTLSQWDAARERVRRSHPGAYEVNAYLQRVRSEAEAARAAVAGRGLALTAERLARATRERLDGREKPETDFLAYARQQLGGYQRRGQHGTYRSYKSVLAKLAEYVRRERGGRLPVGSLTPSLLEDWATWLAEERGNNRNTAGKALSVVRTFTRAAMRDGLMPRADYPFDHIALPSEEVKKDTLTPDELDRVLALELPEGRLIWHVHGWWAFAFYAGGMRFSDAAALRWRHLEGWPSQETRVRYRMQKTTEVAGVPLTPGARRVIERYPDRSEMPAALVFPILTWSDGRSPGTDLDTGSEQVFVRRRSMNSLANKYLKKIARQAKVSKRLSFHVSRHALAHKLLREGWSVRRIQQVLGHSSVAQTEAYLKGFEDTGLDEAYRDLF